MELPKFNPTKTLNELREDRGKRQAENQVAASRVVSEVSLGTMEAKIFVEQTFAWVESEILSEDLRRSYQSAQGEGLESQFLGSLSRHLQRGVQTLKDKKLRAERDLKNEEKLSRLVMQDYLVEVALADTSKALSEDSLAVALSGPSLGKFVEDQKSAALEELSGAAKFLTDHADHKDIQGLTSGTADGLSSMLFSIRYHKGLRVLDDHATMTVEWNDAYSRFESRPKDAEASNEKDMPSTHEGQFVADVIKRERPLARTVSKYVEPVLAILEGPKNSADQQPPQEAKPIRSNPIMRMFGRR